MPFVDPLHRKREGSLSRGAYKRPRAYRDPRLAEVRYDGSGSGKSATSASSALSAKGSVITRRVKRGVASMLSFFGKSDKECTCDSDESTIYISQNGKHAGFTHANDSNATTIVKNPSQLVLIGASHDDDEDREDGPRPESPSRHTASKFSMSRKPSRLDLRRSTSTSVLYNKLQHKILNTFNNDPTVVVKPSLRSRPSVQTLQNEAPDWMPSQLSSSPSTYVDSSGSSPKNANKYTPVTSDGLPSTPSSVRRYEGISLVDNDQSLLLNYNTVASRLSTIPENSNQRTATIRTVEATAAAKIFFEKHFKVILSGLAPRQIRKERLEAQLHKRGASSALQYETFQAWYTHESNTLRRSRVLSMPATMYSTPSSVAVGEFEIVKVLGKGSFGVVRLVRERPVSDRKGYLSLANLQSRLNLRGVDGYRRGKRGVHKLKKDVYAMKVIRKSDMLRNGQEGHLHAERDFLAAAEGSKWIVPLLAAFQDTKFLYLVMDFCIGGDFLGLLIRKGTLPEEATKWYVAEMILCIEEAHRMKWIHRDVKPDNFLITSEGHLKISDFGLAFDGDWDHDQKFYHRHRSSLVEKLGLEVLSDNEDVAEENQIVNARKVAEIFPPPGCQPPKKQHALDDDLDDIPILDHRNEKQRRRLARSVVGTSQYMAPEVIHGDLYDGRCD